VEKLEKPCGTGATSMIEIATQQERKASWSRADMRPAAIQTPPKAGPPPQHSPWRWGAVVLLALLAGLLIVNHGCHGDEDTELFSRGWWTLF
jgi:hypothetical protein